MCNLNNNSKSYFSSFDLSNKDTFFDSKTRSSIVSISMENIT